ncbi:hypothetical protein V9K67_16555 [Paraflavisolibacter sp. H34]|uniref:hypothetical protein n=1 Tax=Huijunlia imazamoxiresistens TaxID=3127457 RepID=UPI00301B4DB5
METTNPTTTRSQRLALLCREQSEDILFAGTIRQEVKNGTPPFRIAAYVNWFWNVRLQPHFLSEEHEISTVLPAGHSLVEKLHEDHEAIADLVLSLSQRPATASLLRLARVVECHAQFEEDYLFRVIGQA